MNVDRFLADLTAYRTRSYTQAVDDLLVAVATGNRPAAADARLRLEDVTNATAGTAEIIGATTVLTKVAKIRGDMPEAFAGGHPAQTLLPSVTFEEAVADFVERTPVTIRPAAQRTAQAISKLYSEQHVVAFAKSAEAAVTSRVQDLIVSAVRDGVTEADIGRRIVANVSEVKRRTEGWSEAYARMAFRTNVNTAVTAGRFRQVQDPDVKAVIPAFRFDAVGDRDTRSNHDAADGIVMAADSQEWRKIAPPLGYNCRCQVTMVSVLDLRRANKLTPTGQVINDKVPPDAFADPGFRHGGRPDLALVALSR